MNPGRDRVFRIRDWEICPGESLRPRVLVIELTTACNLSCRHCFRQASPGLRDQYMDTGLYKKILLEAVETGVERIVFTGWGEPTLHPGIREIISETKRAGLEVVLNTNGTGLRELARDLVLLGVDEVYVSIDSLEEHVYRSLRRPGELSVSLEGLRVLEKAKREAFSTRPLVKTVYTINKMNIYGLSESLKRIASLGVSEVFYSLYIPVPGAEDLDCLGDESCREVLERELSRVSIEAWKTGLLRIHRPVLRPSTTRSCPYVSERALFVRSDGLVSPCIHYSRDWVFSLGGVVRRIYEVVIGDLWREGLRDIWSRHIETLLRLDMLQTPSCLDCLLERNCYYTYSNKTDCLGQAPSCAHCPYLHGMSYCPL